MPLFSINVMKANIYKTSTLEILVFILPFQPEILTLPVSFHIDGHSTEKKACQQRLVLFPVRVLTTVETSRKAVMSKHQPCLEQDLQVAED